MAEAISRFVRMFEASEEASVESRDEAERARDYYDGKQLTAAELAALAKRKQPVVIENLIRPKIDGLCGLERQTRTDPVAYPRTEKDNEAAQVATDVLRYVADDQKLDIKRSAVFQHMLTEGFGGVEVGAVERRGVIDPTIALIDWDRLFFDPHSSKLDFSDAAYLGYLTWMDADKAKRMWPDRGEVIDYAVTKGTATDGETYEDKPRWKYWGDSKRNRVRIVTMYHLAEDGWNRVVFTLGGVLEDDAPSPYLDEDGKPACALIMQSAYVDRDNDRYGIVRDLFSLQDEVNKRRSKFLHLANSTRARIGTGVQQSPAEIRRELQRPDGIVIGERDDFEEIGNGQMAAGHFTLLAEAKEAIQGIGPNAQMQGKQSGDPSGRAILAMQQAGMTEMAPLLDGLRDFNIRVFRAIWNRCRQFWTEERWVRITDDEKAVRFAGVNVPQAALAMRKIKEALDAGKLDQQTAQQYAMQVQSDPAMMQPANVLSEMDVDIQIDEVQNTPTLHAEQFEQLVQLASSGMMQVPPEIIIRASGLRDKQKLLDILEEQKQGAAQAGQAQQEMQQRAMIAEVAGKEADAALKQAKAEREAANVPLDQAKVEIDAFEAGASIAA